MTNPAGANKARQRPNPAADDTLSPLLIAAAGGCSASFAQLYELTHRRIFGIVLRIVRHRAEADADVENWADTAGRWRHRGTPAESLFCYATRQFNSPVDVPALVAELGETGNGLLRAKGVVLGLDGEHWLIQVVGRRVSIEAMGTAPSALAGHLACITLAQPSNT